MPVTLHEETSLPLVAQAILRPSVLINPHVSPSTQYHDVISADSDFLFLLSMAFLSVTCTLVVPCLLPYGASGKYPVGEAKVEKAGWGRKSKPFQRQAPTRMSLYVHSYS